MSNNTVINENDIKNDIKNDNIIFLLEEKTDTLINNNQTDNNNGEENVQQILQSFEADFELVLENDNIQAFNTDIDNSYSINHLSYFQDKEFYGDNEFYYNQECTVKDLLKICEFYEIDKHIKTSKCKKRDIIETLVYFESLPENVEIVQRRNIMWAYITELQNEPKMKKYIIWN
jgi:hypothetical protein